MIENLKRNQRLVGLISKNPGIQFRELMRATGMKNGVLSHYLGKLEKNGSVQVHRESRKTRFYPLNITLEESKVIKSLRRKTPRDIISTLILHDKLDFSTIVKNVKKSPSTVSLYLSQLVEDEIVRIQFTERKKLFQIADKLLVDRLIEEYRPGAVEKATSGLEDVINSL